MATLEAPQQEAIELTEDTDAQMKIKAEPSSQEPAVTSNDNNNNSNSNNNNGNETENASGGGTNQDDDQEFDDQNDQDPNNQANNSSNSNEAESDVGKTNLIVNYLPQQMTDEQFVDLFEKFGKMKSCKIVRNRMTGYSYGFGFADFETHEQALKAIEELNGQEVDNKKIKVAFARPAGQDIKQANLYVKNIPTSWSQDDVRKVFEPYGQIIQVRVLGNDRGVAFVLFDLRKQAQDALEAMNGKKVDGCEEPFEIKFAAEKKGEKRGNRGGVRNRGGRDRNNQRSGSLGGGGGARNNNQNNQNNQNNNNRNNRGNSDNRLRSTSQGRGGGGGGGGFGGPGGNMYKNNNSQYGGGNMNGGVGPMRQQPNRMNRYAPFVPMQQSPAMVPQAAPMAHYGYAQQPMLPYMMPNQMMQMSMSQHHQQPQQHHHQTMAGMGSGPHVNPYAMAPQMAPIGYAQPPMSQPSLAMNNMYNVASTTMNNAAQMQPQLGQPMSTIRSAGGLGGLGGSLGMSTGGGGGGGMGGGGGGGGPQNDGVTLFVYNVGPECDDNELRDMFSTYGTVTRSNVVRKAPGGESKGFGFVTLKTRDQASAAINALNNVTKNGRSLQVSFKK